MKEQPTITYIKNGQEKTVKLNFWNKKKILAKIYYYYCSRITSNSNKQSLKVNKDIELVLFKNMSFKTDKISCESDETICIFENCIFKNIERSNSISFYDASFQIINPKFVNISNINSLKTKDFEFIQYDEQLSKEILMTFNVVSRNISLQGNLVFSNLSLVGNKIVIGTKKEETEELYEKANGELIEKETGKLIERLTKVTLLDFGFRNTFIDATTLELKNCLIENLSENITMELYYDNLIIDDVSLIDTYGEFVLNGSAFSKINDECRVISEEQIQRQAIISILKGYKNILCSKIETKKENLLQHELLTLKQEIKTKEKELEDLKNNYQNQTDKKDNKIVKSLSRKPGSYFDKK